MKTLITQSQASREMARLQPVPTLEELQSQENTHQCVSLEQGEAFTNCINLNLKPLSSSPCKYLEIDCLVSQMSKHCNNDYTQCQTYKYYERWGKMKRREE